MDTGPRIDSYQWRGGREAMLRWGPRRGPTVVVVLPLFEEANRSRATIVAMLEALAGQGVSGALPDLPGTGDSVVATIDARLDDWREAFAAAASALPAPVHVVGIRAGASVTGQATVASAWLLSPQSGRDAVRELRRLRALGADGLYGGNDLHDDFLSALEEADQSPITPSRTVRLAGDSRPADLTLDAAAPWRAAEPQRDEVLAQALAHDIARWLTSCAG